MSKERSSKKEFSFLSSPFFPEFWFVGLFVCFFVLFLHVSDEFSSFFLLWNSLEQRAHTLVGDHSHGHTNGYKVVNMGLNR